MNEKPGNWLWPILKPLWPQLRNLLSYSLFVNLLALATPIFVLQVYDRVVFHAGLTTLQGLTLGMVAVIAFDFMLRQARSRLMQKISLRIDVELGRRLFNKLAALPLRTLEMRSAGFWQGLFRDLEQVRNIFGGPTAVLLVDLPFVILFIGLIALIAAPLLPVLAFVTLAFLINAWWSSWAVRKATANEQSASFGRDSLVAELVAGRATVKALALSETVRPLWEERHAKVIARSLERGSLNDGFGNAGMSLTVVTTILMTIIGALAILDHQMTVGSLIAANMLSSRVVSPLNQLVGAWRGFAAYRESARRLEEAFRLPEERIQRTMELDRPKGDLTLEQVSFLFNPAGQPVLENIEFSMRPGAIHGIVGRNGSGKSTLLKLMGGLYQPASGRILLDGADMNQLSREDLARWIGYMPQDGFLFAGSIRQNILNGAPGADDAALLEITRTIGVHEDIVDLPDGYDTDIGEAGGMLSAGQRQKIALARALIGDPPVLLLDEPTSNLDRPSEERLRLALTGLSKDRNVILVTHSPILLAACTNLVVVDHGKIVMGGKASEVLPKLFGGQGTPPALKSTT